MTDIAFPNTIRAWPNIISWAKALSLLLGLAILTLVLVTAMTGKPVGQLIATSEKLFSGLLIAVFIGLLYASVLALTKIHGQDANQPGIRSWFETGVQSANAIATLALTCTLLGISLGIGSLSGHELNPTTIPQVIKGLTEHFAMAFMTTVIGLPVSAALRSALLVSYSHAEERANPQFQKGE